MVFLLALIFLMYAHLFIVLNTPNSTIQNARYIALHSISGLLGAIGALIGFGLLDSISSEATSTRYNWSPMLFFAGSVASLLLFGRKTMVLVRSGAKSDVSGIRFGMHIWAVMAALYIGFTVIDHWWFFRGENAGIASAELLGVKETTCSGMVLVREEDRSAVYRCPEIVFGGFKQWPFALWPSYSQGESVELKRAIERLKETAQPIRVTTAFRNDAEDGAL